MLFSDLLMGTDAEGEKCQLEWKLATSEDVIRKEKNHVLGLKNQVKEFKVYRKVRLFCELFIV